MSEAKREVWGQMCEAFREWLVSDGAAHGETGLTYERNRALCWIQLEAPGVLERLESAQPAERGPCLNCQAPFSAHPLKKHAILAWIRPCAGGRTDYFEADPPPPQPKGKP